MSESETQSWRAPMPREGRNYPYNCWWVAALSSEVGRDLLGRWMLDMPVLLYRTEDGRAVAVENRCPHRAAPLSLGCLKGDNVQCGYHGFTFAPDGACVDAPSMGTALPAATIRSFPVIEQNAFVWVYLGDPAKLSEVPPPHNLEWTEDPAFAFVQGRMDVKANYMLLKENVLDLTHFGYVHAKSFGISDWIDPPRSSTDGDVTSYHKSFVHSPLPPVFADPLGLAAGTPYNRENYGSFVSPALQIAAVDFVDPEMAPSGANSASVMRPRRLTRPAWFISTSLAAITALRREMAGLLKGSEIGFAEDEAMIEAVQDMMSRDPRGASATEISVKSDAPGIQARRIVERWMERETG